MLNVNINNFDAAAKAAVPALAGVYAKLSSKMIGKKKLTSKVRGYLPVNDMVIKSIDDQIALRDSWASETDPDVKDIKLMFIKLVLAERIPSYSGALRGTYSSDRAFALRNELSKELALGNINSNTYYYPLMIYIPVDDCCLYDIYDWERFVDGLNGAYNIRPGYPWKNALYNKIPLAGVFDLRAIEFDRY